MRKLISATLLLTMTIVPVLANDFGFGIELIKKDNDLLIQNVIPNSIADQNGLKAGQKILKFNGKSINKLKENDFSNINTYKSLKLVTTDNKQYSLKQENIDLLKSYNYVNNTFNNKTEYKIKNFTTEKIILPNSIDSKHVKYLNAYLNYADAISIDNSKRYVQLFKITDENIKSTIEKNKNNSENLYVALYNENFLNNRKSDIYGNAFKHFLELAIYEEYNKNLIAKQISKFNSTEKKQYAQLVYNTRIIANLYNYSSRELDLFLIKHVVSANLTDIWHNDLKAENNAYNERYKELCNLLSNNKIEINKPGPLSNREQLHTGITPNEKWVEDKQIVVLAQEKGYNPNDNAEIKKINDVKLAAQKQAELDKQKAIEEQKRLEEEKIKKKVQETQKATQDKKKPDYSKLKRTKAYPKFFYQIAKECENQIKIGIPTTAPFTCMANKLSNPIYYYDNNGYVNGTLPYAFATFYAPEIHDDYNSVNEKELQQIYNSMMPTALVKAGEMFAIASKTINKELYDLIMYGIKPKKNE